VQIKTETRNLRDLKATNAYLRLGTDVTELEKSIQTVGLIAPLVISTDNVILAGARRYQALLNLGHTEAPVVIIDKGDLEKELISIDENLVRKDLTKIEVEGHLRRAKEIYQALNPHEETEVKEVLVKNEEDGTEKKTVILPAEKFLNMVAEKTGLSPKQIHEAINRDELASDVVKDARHAGELSISQTNELVKLSKADQKKSLNHVKTLPVREIKSFVKIAKSQGVEEALKATPKLPHAREFGEIEITLKKLQKKLKQLELEGITMDHFPLTTQKVFHDVMKFTNMTSIEGEFESRFVEDQVNGYSEDSFHA
jgi:ParB family chromosome partitioning protein